MTRPRPVRLALSFLCVPAALGLGGCRATADAPRASEPTYVVTGLVEAPGPRRFEGDLTLFEAIAAAGPQAGAGDLDRVRLIRAGGDEQVVDLSGVILRGDSSRNVHVHAGDVIEVRPAATTPEASTPR